MVITCSRRLTRMLQEDASGEVMDETSKIKLRGIGNAGDLTEALNCVQKGTKTVEVRTRATVRKTIKLGRGQSAGEPDQAAQLINDLERRILYRASVRVSTRLSVGESFVSLTSVRSSHFL